MACTLSADGFRVVIPARMGSTRLPGKPLLKIAGRPMLLWVAERAAAAGAEEVLIATDDAQIADIAAEAGFAAELTSANHRSGSDRVMEVVARRGWPDDQVVVNVQGDEPLIPPEAIRQVGTYLCENRQAGAATLALPVSDVAAGADPNIVKVVRSDSGRALYFSRQLIPYYRGAPGGWLRHVGIYGYRVGVLRDFCAWPPSALELAESLEQLRLLANDVPLLVLDACADVPLGVDTPEDLARARSQLEG